MEDEKQPQTSSAFSLEQFNNLIAGIELLYALARRLSDAIAKQVCPYLIQEASMAFVKTMMSLQGFLRFIPASRYHAKEGDFAIDLSSASVMARQVIEDIISFFYLSEPGLTKDQKDFRELVWRYHGATEEIEAAGFAGISNAGLSPRGVECERFRRRFEDEPFNAMLIAIKRDRRGRIRQGRDNHVLHDHEILERRAIKTDSFDLSRKLLSNFAHFSTFSHQQMMATSADWEKSWRRFLPPSLFVANFTAEVIEAFIETFPQTRPLPTDDERWLIARLREPIRKGDEQTTSESRSEFRA